MSTEAFGESQVHDEEMEVQILDAINKWLDRDVKDKVMELEHDDIYPQEMVDQMVALGLFGAMIPEEYGGLGLSASTYAKIVTTISEVWMSLTGIFNSHLIMAATVNRFGTDWQKQHYLPKFATGEIRGGLALTEPDCGTDLQAVRMRAVRDGDDYVINGTKTWISNGIYGSCFSVLVKTDPDIEPRYKGTSLFLCENPGWLGFSIVRHLHAPWSVQTLTRSPRQTNRVSARSSTHCDRAVLCCARSQYLTVVIQ